jgi:hypothetical protein
MVKEQLTQEQRMNLIEQIRLKSAAGTLNLATDDGVSSLVSNFKKRNRTATEQAILAVVTEFKHNLSLVLPAATIVLNTINEVNKLVEELKTERAYYGRKVEELEDSPESATAYGTLKTKATGNLLAALKLNTDLCVKVGLLTIAKEKLQVEKYKAGIKDAQEEQAAALAEQEAQDAYTDDELNHQIKTKLLSKRTEIIEVPIIERSEIIEER